MRKFLYILYQPYKWLVYIPLLALSTCVFVFIGVIMIFTSGDRLANRTTGVWWARFNSFFIPMAVKVTGKENIERNRSYIIVANHQSSLDIFLLFGWLGVDIKWVIKKELRKVPVFGYAAEKGGNIIIDRSNTEEAYRSLEKAREKVRDGTSIVILPEGTRSKTGEMGKFKRGAFQLALELGLPVLPVTIAGTNKILSPGTLNLFPGRAVMKIHRAVDTASYGPDGIDRLREDVRAIIEGGFGDDRAGAWPVT